MALYHIKKSSNGEYKEVEKTFTLNVTKYCSNKSVLYFEVENEENPTCFDVDLFYNIMVSRIQSGLIESLSYNNGVLKVSFKDGNTLRTYTYDFNIEKFKGNLNQSAVNELQLLLYKLESLWKENPLSEVTTEQKCLRVILDIIDGVRMPIYEDDDELLRVFQVYNKDKNAILETLLANVVFHDEDNNPINYSEFMRKRKIEEIRPSVLEQMETAMLYFAYSNDAVDLYTSYLSSTFIPTIEIVQVRRDEDGNVIPDEEPSEPEKPAAEPVSTTEVEELLIAGYELAKKHLGTLRDILAIGAKKLSERLEETQRTKK